MSRRSRRLRPPWIPGFWLLLTALVLGCSVIGYYWVLARSTQFKRVAAPAEARPATATGK